MPARREVSTSLPIRLFHLASASLMAVMSFEMPQVPTILLFLSRKGILTVSAQETPPSLVASCSILPNQRPAGANNLLLIRKFLFGVLPAEKIEVGFANEFVQLQSEFFADGVAATDEARLGHP